MMSPQDPALPDSSPGPGSSTQSSLSRLGFLLDHRRLRVAWLAATSLAGGLLEAAFLVVVTRVAFALTDSSQTVEIVGGRSGPIEIALVAAFVLILGRSVASTLAAWQSARLGADVIAHLRKRIGGAYLRATWSEQHGARSGRLQELLTSFTGQGATLVAHLTNAVTAGSYLAALLVISIVVSPAASIVVVVAVVGLASLLRPLRTAVRKQAATTASTGMEFATSLSEVSQLGMEMHVFGVAHQAERQVDRLIDVDAAASQRLTFLRNLVPTVYTSLAYLALVGALAIIATLGVADIAAVGTVMLLMLRSLGYGQAVQTSIATINSGLPYLDVLQSELTRYERSRAEDSGVPVGNVRVLSAENVWFAYTADEPVLRDVSFTIGHREVVGVVGPSGSGKSSLIQLLLGLREPSCGRVLADGREIRLLSKQEWVRRVTFVPQQAHLVAGTVADNIRFFREDVTQAQIEQAARLANLHEEVAEFPQGYARQVGERGAHLSGGQQQRLVIARALVERPDILVLDEPTSALDVRSEHLIRQTLDQLRERMTIVIIAHRLPTLEICDRIMVIQDGELRGFDTPANLERSSDFYREALALSGLR